MQSLAATVANAERGKGLLITGNGAGVGNCSTPPGYGIRVFGAEPLRLSHLLWLFNR